MLNAKYNPASLLRGKERQRFIVKELRHGLSALHRAMRHIRRANRVGLGVEWNAATWPDYLPGTLRDIIDRWAGVLRDVERKLE